MGGVIVFVFIYKVGRQEHDKVIMYTGLYHSTNKPQSSVTLDAELRLVAFGVQLANDKKVVGANVVDVAIGSARKFDRHVAEWDVNGFGS